MRKNPYGCTYLNGWCEYLDNRDGEHITQKDLKEGCYLLPTISQVLKWLRKKKIVVSILPTGYNKETGLPGYYYVIYDVAEYFWKKYEYPQSFVTWEECELSAIKYVLDNLI